MRDIRRPDIAESIVKRLTTIQEGGPSEAVFPTIMDLLIFCAGVGLTHSRTQDVPPGGGVVPYRIFENNQKEGYIYLIALASKKDPQILSGDRDEEIADLFERYAAGGLELVTSWINTNPSDISGVQILIEKIQSQLGTAASAASTPSAI